jgi:hypothetical protein
LNLHHAANVYFAAVFVIVRAFLTCTSALSFSRRLLAHGSNDHDAHLENRRQR